MRVLSGVCTKRTQHRRCSGSSSRRRDWGGRSGAWRREWCTHSGRAAGSTRRARRKRRAAMSRPRGSRRRTRACRRCPWARLPYPGGRPATRRTSGRTRRPSPGRGGARTRRNYCLRTRQTVMARRTWSRRSWRDYLHWASSNFARERREYAESDWKTVGDTKHKMARCPFWWRIWANGGVYGN